MAISSLKFRYMEEEKMNKEHHVVPNAQGGWDIKQTHHSKKLHFDTKEEAITKARELSSKEHTELVIHDKQEGLILRTVMVTILGIFQANSNEYLFLKLINDGLYL